MERVKTLVEKLNEQLKNEALLEDMLTTVQMLSSELVHLKLQKPVVDSSLIYVQIPQLVERTWAAATAPQEKSVKEEPVQEKQIEILKIDEAEVAAELDEIKKKNAEREKIQVQSKPALLFDPIDDIPTLAHQQPVASKKELHEKIAGENKASRNEKLKAEKIELGDTLKDAPVKDLKKAIGINDRFQFIKELFNGDETMYERSIKTINGFNILAEAEYWIRRELKLKLAWKDGDPIVKQFDHLVRRRFA